MFTKLFILFIVICLGIIGYSVFTYIQDYDQSTSTDQIAEEDGNKQSDKTPESEETEEDPDDTKSEAGETVSPATTSGVDDLSEAISQEVKTEPEEDEVNLLNYLTVSFVNYDAGKGTLNIGAMLRFETSQTCELKITSEENIIAYNSPTIENRGISGCRFNNIDVGSLDTPSNDTPWQMLLTVRSRNNEILAKIKEDITSRKQLEQFGTSQ